MPLTTVKMMSDQKVRKPYKVVESRYDGYDAIQLVEEPFTGIVVKYGKVSFNADEDNDTLTLNFDYDIIDRAKKEFGNLEPFEKYLGELLEQLIAEGIQENNLTYTGGIDENRTGDLIEPDPQ